MGTEREDDEALSWAGDSDPSLTVREIDNDEVLDDDEVVAVAPATSPFLLVAYGLFAGLYLICAIGWVVHVTSDDLVFDGLLSEIMYQFGEFLAIAAPAIWFATAFALTRDRTPIVRVLALILGLVVVVPWPFVLAL